MEGGAEHLVTVVLVEEMAEGVDIAGVFSGGFGGPEGEGGGGVDGGDNVHGSGDGWCVSGEEEEGGCGALFDCIADNIWSGGGGSEE